MDSITWPELPYGEWRPTKETLHRYTQIVGKIRMALMPPRNHWWHVTLRVSALGLTTGPMPYGGHAIEIEFDLVHQRMHFRRSDGREALFALRGPLPVARFHDAVFASLDAIGVRVSIDARPFDLADSPAFPDDTEHRDYDADAVERWWSVLRLSDQVLDRFAARFSGKTSPTQLFWHSFDLAHARYSGRPAPVAGEADPVSAEAYSHEVIAFGWWPGDERTTAFPAFYSYTAPEPAGLTDHRLEPGGAAWQPAGSGSLAILPYDTVRTAPDPADTLLAFFESAYRAGATSAGWDLDAFATPGVADGG